MGNVWRVLKRDVLRLLKTPSALVVVLALLVLPSAYTWYNVAGFWNPYDNTGNLRVCVVNQDAGGETELTGQLNVGEMIEEELRENDQLSWQFTDYATAMEELRAGKSYAAFVIPEGFTEDLLSLTTGEFTQPDIQYYVNEKTGPVAPKITDAGATTLDETVNSAFVGTVSNVVAKAVDEAATSSKEELEASRSHVSSKLSEACSAISGARETLGSIASATESAQAKAAAAQGSLAQAQEGISSAADALARISSLTGTLQTDLSHFCATASPAVSMGLQAIAQASASANDATGSILGAANQANGSVDAALSQTQGALASTQAIIESLKALEGSVPAGQQEAFEQAIAELERQNESMQAMVDSLQAVNSQAANVGAAAGQASDAFNAAAQQATSSAQQYSDVLFGTTMPALTDALGQLSTTAIQLSGAVAQQKTLVSQTSGLLDQLSDTLGTAQDALSQTDSILAGVEDELATVRTDVLALGQSGALASLLGESGLNAAELAEFMSSPTKITTEQLYDLNSYGAAMAPLFMNLTLWIGAFMLLVIMKQEVDAEGIRRLTLKQRYLGRFLLFAALVVLQAVICCAGVLALGVHAANVPALFLAAIVASLTYLSIIYALSVTLQHIGKGLCIILVFAQIPGATGLYPVEMTSGFFQAVYPFFPFTYGINALREAIGGLYGGQYLSCLGMLALFFAVFMALGLAVRPLMANVNRMTAEQVRESGIFNGEDAEAPARPYRFSQIIRALADKEEYRIEIQRRYERFNRLHPRLIRGAMVVGIAVPLALTLVFALTPTEKVVLLTIWLVCLTALFVFLVVVESLKASLERQMQLDGLGEAELIGLGVTRAGAADEGEEGPAAQRGAEAEGGSHA